jgi:hypothetical protein
VRETNARLLSPSLFRTKESDALSGAERLVDVGCLSFFLVKYFCLKEDIWYSLVQYITVCGTVSEGVVTSLVLPVDWVLIVSCLK